MLEIVTRTASTVQLHVIDSRLNTHVGRELQVSKYGERYARSMQ